MKKTDYNLTVRMPAWIAGIVGGLTFLSCWAQAASELPLDDPKAVIRNILPAVQAWANPVSGKGRAIVRRENSSLPYDGIDMTVDFVFKDDKSRADRYVEGTRDKVWVETDSYGLDFSLGSASVVVTKPTKHDTVRYGNDFHPKFFSLYWQRPIAYWLKSMLGDGVETSVKVDEQGILHIAGKRTFEPPDPQLFVAVEMALDPKKGLRPVFFKKSDAMRSDDPDPEGGAFVLKLDWTQYGSVWYVAETDCYFLPGESDRTKLAIESFQPNVEVSDGDFTLAGLGIPDGTPVADHLAGIEYAYGTPTRLLDELEKPLAEAEFVKRVAKRQAEATHNETDSNSADQNTVPHFQSQASAECSNSRKSVLVFIALVVGVLAVLLGLIYLSSHRQRK